MKSNNVSTDMRDRQQHEPYPPINREKEINTFRSAISDLRSGISVNTIYEWFGGPGVGKTTLINLLIQLCQKTLNVPWVLFNFKQPEDDPTLYYNDPSRIMEKIVDELARQASLKVDLQEFYKQLDAFRACERPEPLVKKYVEITQSGRMPRDPWWEAQNDLSFEFKLAVEKLTRQEGKVQPAAIFFDETDSIETGLVDWIEEFVFSPLAKLRTVILIYTSLREWNWGRPEVRRRLQANSLPLFNPEQVRLQWVSMASPQNLDLVDELFSGLHTITHGHPYAGQVAISLVNEWTGQGVVIDSHILEQRRAEVEEEIYGKFIGGYAFRNVPAEHAIALRYLAMVRFFDKKMLAEVLKACEPDQFGTGGADRFGRLMLQLNQTQLVIWDRGTTLDPDLRSLIRDYFLSRDPCDIFVKVNNVALAVYKDWLKQRVDNRTMFVLEELYHLSSLAQAGQQFDAAGEPIDLEKKLAERLLEYRTIYGENPEVLEETLERLHGELAHDPDILAHNIALKDRLLEQINRFPKS